jgi:hypothetical protein
MECFKTFTEPTAVDALKLMLAQTNVYITEGGQVECEFATTAKRLRQIAPAIQVANAKLKAAGFFGQWVSGECATCAEYHGAAINIHVAIEWPGFDG